MVLFSVLVLALCYHTVSSAELIPIIPLAILPLDPLLNCNLNLIYLPLLVCGNARCSSSTSYCINGGRCREYYDYKDILNSFKGYTCDCPPGWYGASCNIAAVSCGHILKLQKGKSTSGVYVIRQLVGFEQKLVSVYCDMKTDGGGWTVIQRRVDGSVSFDRKWREYAAGFGDPTGNFWLGLDYIHLLTSVRRQVLRLDLLGHDETASYEQYDDFEVDTDGLNRFYKLISVGKASGSAGDRLSQHEGQYFSTPDQNHGTCDDQYSCAKGAHAGWWFECCYWSELNGQYGVHGFKGVVWGKSSDYKSSKKYTEMKIREFNFN